MKKYFDRWNFDSISEQYEQILNDKSNVFIYKNYDLILRKVFELANFKLKEKILDIGIGTGNLSGLFLPEGKLYGIDISQKMLDSVSIRFPKIITKMGSFLDIPYPGEFFDIIISSFAFHHVQYSDQSLALSEMDRVLKKKGKIILADLMFYDINSKNDFIQECKEKIRLAIEDEFYSIVTKLRDDFELLGYEINFIQMSELVWIIEANKIHSHLEKIKKM